MYNKVGVNWRTVGDQQLKRQLAILPGQILFNDFINNLENGKEDTPSTFAVNTKRGGTDDMLEGRAAIQRDLDRCEKWADNNIMQFNKV